MTIDNKQTIESKQAELTELIARHENSQRAVEELEIKIRSINQEIKDLQKCKTRFKQFATVETLIKALSKYPSDMKVAFDYDDGYSTIDVSSLSIGHKDYGSLCEKRLIIK